MDWAAESLGDLDSEPFVPNASQKRRLHSPLVKQNKRLILFFLVYTNADRGPGMLFAMHGVSN